MKRILTLILLSIHMVGTAQEATMLATYSKEELHADFDLMVNALKEAHAGLYWYNSIPEFDHRLSQERAKLEEEKEVRISKKESTICDFQKLIINTGKL